MLLSSVGSNIPLSQWFILVQVKLFFSVLLAKMIVVALSFVGQNGCLCLPFLMDWVSYAVCCKISLSASVSVSFF